MEALGARTDEGTYLLGIERGATGGVGRVELHVSFVPGDDTSCWREVLANLHDALSDPADGRRPRKGEGAGDMRSRLNALLVELHDQDECREVPAAGEGGKR